MIIPSNTYKLLKKSVLFFCMLIIGVNAQQKPTKLQTIGFVDIEYVLSQIPSYAEAQKKLDVETGIWKKNLDKMYLKLESMRKEYLNEKPLLTEDLIKERENEIELYEREITKAENTYFGVEGKLFELRKQLVTPYQDLVYNAVQTIAKLRKYDMIFEKSSSIVMLYTNNNYDISGLVLRYLQKSEKEIKKEEDALKREESKLIREKRLEDQKKRREELNKKRLEERAKRKAEYDKKRQEKNVKND